MKPTVGNDSSLRLADRLVKASTGDDRGTRRAKRLLAHLQALPMSVILEKVPGASVAQRAKAVGVSRQTFYYWLTGVTRPNDVQARKLKRITGYECDVIRGRA
jgi:hypothetical protein